jgi:hypothetical protein
MNEERTGFWLRQTEHSYGHLWHRYPVTVNQVMMSILKQLIFYCLSNLQITTGVSQLTVYFCYLLNTKYKDWNTSWKVTSHVHVRITLCTVYNRTVFKNGSCCTVRPGKVSCLQKFQYFWMIIRDLFFVSGSTEATKIKKNTAKVCHLYFWSNNSALFEHWNWKSPFKHMWMVCFRSKKGVKKKKFSPRIL